MPDNNQSSSTRARVAKHRAALAGRGTRRVEVTVPTTDAQLVKTIARTLRNDDAQANSIRESIHSLLSEQQATTGKQLIQFLRMSPLVGADFNIERDQSHRSPLELNE